MLERKLMHVLMYPESTTQTPSGSSVASPPAQDPPSPPASGADDDPPDDGRDASDFDWADESAGVEGNEREVAQPPAQQPPAQTPSQQPPAQAPQQPPASAQQPPAQQPPAQQPAQQPATQEGQQPPAEQPQAQQPPAQQPPAQQAGETPEQKQERERREAEEAAKFTQQLENYYQIPEELAARLPTEPEKVLPVLAAKVHQAVLKGMQAWATQAIPAFFQHHQKVTEANNASRKAFFDRWPGLSAHEKHVLEVGRMYRQMNPQATQQDVIEKVGQIVYAALGQQPPTRSNGTPPARPAAAPGAPRPAGTSSSQAGAEPPADNLFTSMAEDMLSGDRGQ